MIVDWAKMDAHWATDVVPFNNRNGSSKTAYGMLKMLWPAVSRGWNEESTINSRLSDYDAVIFTAMSNHDSTPFSSMSVDEIIEIIDRIRTRGQVSSENVFKAYAPASMSAYIGDITRLLNAAIENHMFDSVQDLTGTCLSLNAFELEEAVNEFLSVPRSLTPRQQLGISLYLLSEVDRAGEEICLALMLLGLRCNEAAGAKWSDIKPMPGHPDCFELYIDETTSVGSNEVKAGAKTSNGPRRIPLPKCIYYFLMRRKEFVSQSVHNAFPIDTLPIGCRLFDYRTNTMTKHINEAAKEMFRKLNISSKVLAYMDAELRCGGPATLIGEKEPTAYLFRRQFITNMFLVGADEYEIQYVVGHRIDDEYIDRCYYTVEMRYALYLKIELIPIFNNTLQPVSLGSEPLHIETHGSVSVKIGQHRNVTALISALEPYDSLSLHTNISKESVYCETPQEPHLKRRINISKQLLAEYSKSKNNE